MFELQRCLSLRFRRLSPSSHRLSPSSHSLWLSSHRLSPSSHRLSPPFTVLSPPFTAVPPAQGPGRKGRDQDGREPAQVHAERAAQADQEGARVMGLCPCGKYGLHENTMALISWDCGPCRLEKDDKDALLTKFRERLAKVPKVPVSLIIVPHHPSPSSCSFLLDPPSSHLTTVLEDSSLS